MLVQVFLLSLAFLCTARSVVSRALPEECKRLSDLQKQLEGPPKLSYVGKECTGSYLPEPTTRSELIKQLKEVLRNSSDLRISVKTFASLLANHSEHMHVTRTRTKEFFSKIVPRHATASIEHFYRTQGAFAIVLHQLNWELLKSGLMLDLGKAPAGPQDQQIRNGLKTEAESQTYWLKFIGCRLRRLAELGSPGVQIAPPPDTAPWELFACGDNVLDARCLSRNKQVSHRLSHFLHRLRRFINSL